MTRIRLTDIYGEADFQDEEEALHHYLPDDVDAVSYEVVAIPNAQAAELLTSMGDMTVLEAFECFAEDDQIRYVEEMVEDELGFDDERIIVLKGNRVIDRNHHLVAAVKLARDVQAIDLDQPHPWSAPEHSPAFG